MTSKLLSYLEEAGAVVFAIYAGTHGYTWTTGSLSALAVGHATTHGDSVIAAVVSRVLAFATPNKPGGTVSSFAFIIGMGLALVGYTALWWGVGVWNSTKRSFAEGLIGGIKL